MAFWSGEKVKKMLSGGKIIEPYAEAAVKYGAYELSLGPEAFITSYEDNKKKILADGEQLVIPPGQFGLLLTEEKISIPTDAIAFISIKASIKFRGLVNVSGFHVDPGFSGRLKFSVYNAGSRDIVLQRKRRIFLLWFSDLDQPTQPYAGDHAYQSEITPEDVMQIAGKIASPGQLRNDIHDLDVKFQKELHRIEQKVDNVKVLLTFLITLLIAVLAFALRGCLPTGGQSSLSNKVVPVAIQTNSAGGAVVETPKK